MSFKYIPSFDGVRCIAVCFVLLLHGSYGFFKGGWVGVDLFFVLSGYLITSLLKSEYFILKKINLINFWIRRALRLLPPLFITIIAVTLFWKYFNFNFSNPVIADISSLLYFTNFVNPILLGPLSHLWSLSVEEHFYIFWPLIMSQIILKKSKEFNLIFLGSIILIVSILRVFGYYYSNYLMHGVIVFDAYRCTLFRIDSISCGCLLAIVNVDIKLKKKLIQVLTGFIVIVLIWILFFLDLKNLIFQDGGFVLINCFCVLVVFLAVKVPHHFLLSNNVFRYIGKRSYGLYLYHFPIFLVCENLRVNHSYINFILVTILRVSVTFLIAGLSFSYIESPILKLKAKFGKAAYN